MPRPKKVTLEGLLSDLVYEAETYRRELKERSTPMPRDDTRALLEIALDVAKSLSDEMMKETPNENPI